MSTENNRDTQPVTMSVENAVMNTKKNYNLSGRPWYEVAMMLDSAEKQAKAAFTAYVNAARYGSATEYDEAKKDWERLHRHCALLGEVLLNKRGGRAWRMQQS